MSKKFENISEYLARQKYLKRFSKKEDYLEKAGNWEERLKNERKASRWDGIFKYGIFAIVILFMLPKALMLLSLQKAEGEVVAIGEYLMGRGKRLKQYYPVIDFSANSNIYRYEKPNEVLFKKFRVGDKVKIIYKPQNPDDAWIFSFLGYWYPLPNLLISMMLAFVGAGVVMIVTMKYK